MAWKEVAGKTYLIRKSSTGAQKSLGPRTPEAEAIYESFQQRKQRAQDRFKGMKRRLEEQRKLNRLYRVGRTPNVVVRVLAALEAAELPDSFLVVGTHAIYAYETAAGVLVDTGALATRDLDLFFDARKRLAFASTLKRGDEGSLIKVLQKADPSFRVMRDQLQTAVNDDGFEVVVIRDFWAVQIDQGETIGSGQKFDHLVVSASGEMATMRTLHPLDFIRLKLELAARRIAILRKRRRIVCRPAWSSKCGTAIWDWRILRCSDA